MKVAVMQPYLFPYIGYFQLINAVDSFVLLDDVNYIKKGWINRNRILINGAPYTFSLPLKKVSQNKRICDLDLADEFGSWVSQFAKKFRYAYSGAPACDEIGLFLQKMTLWDDVHLVDVLEKTLQALCARLQISTKFYRSSCIDYNPSFRGQDRIVEICLSLGATDYINMNGGRELYKTFAFKQKGLCLHFLEALPKEYSQFEGDFVPFLSIIDVMSFNSCERRKALLAAYSLVQVKT